MRIGALASGSGTILAALLEAELPIAVVVVARPSPAEKVAAEYGVACEVVLRSDFSKSFDREGYSAQVVEVLERHGVELVVMAGFGTVLSEVVQRAYPHRVMNTPP